jgi:hydroxypyruvate isomerase
MLRFAANVSILFQDCPLLERFARARAAGFAAVELWWPSGADLVAIERAVRYEGLQLVLLNFDAGDMPSGDRGLLSHPDRQLEFRNNVPVALEFAGRLGCRQLNALVGLEIAGLGRDEQLSIALENVAWAADRAAEQGATVLIEAVNTIENGPYLLATTRQAADFVSSVGRQNVKLQYDVYHMQRMEGNIAATLRRYIGQIAHVQIADSPGRGEPGTGEIHYPYIFQVLEELGYQGYVGLEYRPSTGSTEKSLAWLPEGARGRGIEVSAS